MSKQRTRYKTGELVEVRGWDQILLTLDENGALDGLPFMPEMLEFCGRRFRISRHVEKTCVEWASLAYDIREFANDDVVFLEDLRCPGTSHDVAISRMIALIALPIFRKIIGKRFSPVAGRHARTPTKNLDLQAEELVEVKAVNEIAETLDPTSKNRGLVYDKGLGRFSGRRFRVRNRLDFMILKPTGEMIKPKATVVLDGPTCLCNNVQGGCPRREVIFWREIWLKRVDRLPADSGTYPPERAGEIR